MTDLESSHLQGASLYQAKLQGAWFYQATLHGAELYQAKLQGASLDNAQLQGARLDGAELQGAIARAALLQGASLEGAQLQGADFQTPVPQNPDSQNQNLDSQKTTVVGTNMHNVEVRRTSFEGASLPAVFEDGVKKALKKEEFTALKDIITNEVPEGEERTNALKRIEKLSRDIFGPEATNGR